MKVHHFNCATLCPRAARFLNDSGRLVCHCLLVETDRGLVLVDAGLGEGDLATPRRRLGPMGFILGVRREPADAAKRQVERLGFSAKDVRHIVLTHADLDHAGGIVDFPDAAIHVSRPEHDALARPGTYTERSRYRRCHFAHGPKWSVHDISDGEDWNGFRAVRPLPDVEPDVLLVPLTGHTRGHCAVAVRSENGWLLHAGDNYYDAHEIDPVSPSCSIGFRVFDRLSHEDRAKVARNQVRLRELAARGGKVQIFCAHDPSEFERLAGA